MPINLQKAEFILSAWGDTYYGCYWSRRDVPFPFQHTDIPLTQTGDGRWTWTAEGNDRDITWKLSGRWYDFEATFCRAGATPRRTPYRCQPPCCRVHRPSFRDSRGRPHRGQKSSSSGCSLPQRGHLISAPVPGS